MNPQGSIARRRYPGPPTLPLFTCSRYGCADVFFNCNHHQCHSARQLELECPPQLLGRFPAHFFEGAHHFHIGHHTVINERTVVVEEGDFDDSGLDSDELGRGFDDLGLGLDELGRDLDDLGTGLDELGRDHDTRKATHKRRGLKCSDVVAVALLGAIGGILLMACMKC
ncbi:hypothetical protein DFP72DRAFT_562950 [Ephemerocybe angulata]|uniref:Uncharacterized protein n=1 Tax=Ephemerocybe angulata TaxID=980116 RepID=A0A8H6IEB3_9AGAR|nr:hypothetical protein DFP72DRAFT_562950 [Tulosesus angulatus]